MLIQIPEVFGSKGLNTIRAAEGGKAATWHKYYEGRWEEPGLGGQFTKLNLPYSGYS
jgi:hypothetical protein